MCAEPGIKPGGPKPGGPNPGGPALGKPRSCFNVNFNSYAHGSRSGTKVPLALFMMFEFPAHGTK